MSAIIKLQNAEETDLEMLRLAVLELAGKIQPLPSLRSRLNTAATGGYAINSSVHGYELRKGGQLLASFPTIVAAQRVADLLQGKAGHKVGLTADKIQQVLAMAFGV